MNRGWRRFDNYSTIGIDTVVSNRLNHRGGRHSGSSGEGESATFSILPGSAGVLSQVGRNVAADWSAAGQAFRFDGRLLRQGRGCGVLVEKDGAAAKGYVVRGALDGER